MVSAVRITGIPQVPGRLRRPFAKRIMLMHIIMATAKTSHWAFGSRVAGFIPSRLSHRRGCCALRAQHPVKASRAPTKSARHWCGSSQRTARTASWGRPVPGWYRSRSSGSGAKAPYPDQAARSSSAGENEWSGSALTFGVSLVLWHPNQIKAIAVAKSAHSTASVTMCVLHGHPLRRQCATAPQMRCDRVSQRGGAVTQPRRYGKRSGRFLPLRRIPYASHRDRRSGLI